jgi:hypothetical protein
VLRKEGSSGGALVLFFAPSLPGEEIVVEATDQCKRREGLAEKDRIDAMIEPLKGEVSSVGGKS